MSFDVLGIGCVAVDDLLYVDAYPLADAKLRIRRAERHFGGLTGTALVAAAKLGAKCGFAGLLGIDELSRSVEQNFLDHGIDTTNVVRREDAQPIHSVIIVAEEGNTRNVFYEYSAPIGADPAGPSEECIRDAQVLFLDHIGVPGNIRAAAIAREAGIPVVADLEEVHDPKFPDLLELIDHVVISERFALTYTNCKTAGEAAAALWHPDRDTVAVTCGDRGVWFVSSIHPEPTHLPAFPVNVVDTTGCGDVFHGAYAVSLAYGDGVEERLRFASAAAALKATRPGGQTGAPNLRELTAFLSKNAFTGYEREDL
ncbi:MAG: PfkB family carbohydrate kinase [Fimbriimonas sp.]|nr:PfkB family carbohydrate kinase [Fimbriimonas sp.]